MESKEHALQLIKYFERIASQNENENREVWLKGFNTAQEWVRLIDSESVSQVEVSRFMGVVHANRYRTSAWHDLALGTYHWASTKGFELPPPDEFFASDKLPSKNPLQEVPFQEHAKLLLECFKNYSVEDPESPVWAAGLKAVLEWQRLQALLVVTENDIVYLLGLLEIYKKYTSYIWFDFELGVYKWLKSCGLVQLIPNDFHSLVDVRSR
jgi:hypothetical protein